jgi:hypothetical protein
MDPVTDQQNSTVEHLSWFEGAVFVVAVTLFAVIVAVIWLLKSTTDFRLSGSPRVRFRSRDEQKIKPVDPFDTRFDALDQGARGLVGPIRSQTYCHRTHCRSVSAACKRINLVRFLVHWILCPCFVSVASQSRRLFAMSIVDHTRMPEQDRTAPRLRCAYGSEPMLRRGCFAAVARALSAICFSCQLSIQHLGFAARQFQQVVQIFHVAGVEGFNGTSHSGASRGVIPLRHGAFRKLRAERSRALAPLHFIVAEHFLDRVGEAARRGRSSGIF